jgi:alpha,alpha-trehalose-phosphate synthase [UDP-forming]
MKSARLIVASHRLPVTAELIGGSVQVVPSNGGLTAALAPVVQQANTVWVGATGTSYHPAVEDALARCSISASLEPVYLTDEERRLFYNGFSNEIVWPLFHDLPSRCRFDPEYWHCYCKVNEQFAAVIAGVAGAADVVWVHDYHLMLVAQYLRQARLSWGPIAYFQHIPFPEPSIFAKLPWRAEVLQAIANYDLALFQTEADATHFLQSFQHYCGTAAVREGGNYSVVHWDSHRFVVAALPVSIDFGGLEQDACSDAVQHLVLGIRNEFAGQQLILGLDRLDYTKGVKERLEALRFLLRQHPELHGKVRLLQITIPSRESIVEYAAVRAELERLVCRLNDEYATREWAPVEYLYRPLSHNELLAYYRAADVALVTPIKDGMNLVAKEYCAARSDLEGVLVLSEFAGSSLQLGDDALLVNPYHIEGVAAALLEALRMPQQERAIRMNRLRSSVQKADANHWYAKFQALLTIARAENASYPVRDSAHAAGVAVN